MTIYTKNGKPILKDVNGVYKLVTGDCCCGCESDSRCRLPHFELDFTDSSIGGSPSTSEVPTLTMRFIPLNGQGGELSTVQELRYDAEKDEWKWFVVTNPEPTEDTTCTADECENVKRTNHVGWNYSPNIKLYGLGELQFAFSGTQYGVSVSLEAAVTHSYMTAASYDDGSTTKIYRAARYNPPDGSSFTITIPGGTSKTVSIIQS